MKLVKTIGDEENAILLRVDSAAISPNKDIYIGDNGDYSIKKFDWNGKLIKKVGQRGQGPEDFGSFDSLNFFNNKIYIHDYGNSRIAVNDTDLKKFSYITTRMNRFYDVVIPINEKTFVGTYNNSRQKDKNSIQIINDKEELIKRFFNFSQLGKAKDYRKLPAKQSLISLYSLRKYIVINRKHKLLMVGFQFPNNPMKIWVYDYKGNLIRIISKKLNKEFSFAKHTRTRKIRPDKGDKFIEMNSLISYKDYVLSFISYREKIDRDVFKDKNVCLVFNIKGDYIGEFKVKDKLRYLNVTQDGYLISVNFDVRERDKVYIHKLNF